MLTSSISRSQRVIICAIAAVLVLSWPPDRGHGSNLLTKLMHWAVDPANALPALPPPLPPEPVIQLPPAVPVGVPTIPAPPGR